MYLNISHSQNYLQDPHLVSHLLNKTSMTENDLVLEIGPGKGILTDALSKRTRLVHAVEKDPALAEVLKKQFASKQNVLILEKDFLNYRLPNEPYKVVANIPYNITAEIMQKLFSGKHAPTDSYLIMQREAAYKFTGQPYARESLLGLYYKPLFEANILFTLKPEYFKPMPKVTSVLFRMKKQEVPLVDDMALYKDFVTHAFIAHKPSVKEAFRDVFSDAQFKKLSEDLSFGAKAKPTELTFEQWLGLFRYFQESVDQNKQKKVYGSVEKLKVIQAGVVKWKRTRM